MHKLRIFTRYFGFNLCRRVDERLSNRSESLCGLDLLRNAP